MTDDPAIQVVVTGAGGFVGRVVCRQLLGEGVRVRAVVRQADAATRARLEGTEVVPVGELTVRPDWGPILTGAGAVIHLAARVHVMQDRGTNSSAAYHAINVGVTENLLRASADARVKRFVFLSSIKVNGERTTSHPFTAADAPAPLDAYGRSKWAAEERVRAWSGTEGRSAVILRPPLVYGPGARGNLARLLGWLDRNRPLPLGAIRNRRTLIGVGNLASAITAALQPGEVGGTYLVGDNESVSTPQLLGLLGKVMGRAPKLLPLPVPLLRLGGTLLGRGAEIQRLTESLEVDSTLARQRLGWSPLESLEAGLAAMVHEFRRRPT